MTKEDDVFRDYNLLTMPAKFLVGVCSDDKYPFGEFLANEFGLNEGYYFRIQIPGGLAPLIYPERLEGLCDAAKLHIKIGLEVCPLANKLIVITHSCCGFYKTMLPQFVGNEETDGSKIAEAAVKLFPDKFAQVKVCHALPKMESRKVNFRTVNHKTLQIA